MTWGEWKHTGKLAGDRSWYRRTRLADSQKHVDPKWGEVKLNKITGHGIQVWLREIEDAGLSASSVQKCFHLLSSSLALPSSRA
ncbi:hypothetical protein GS445_18100 [Rhodococcus hoagii]|nr:hypothetical protein [Prescottella equi]